MGVKPSPNMDLPILLPSKGPQLAGWLLRLALKSVGLLRCPTRWNPCGRVLKLTIPNNEVPVPFRVFNTDPLSQQ